MVYLLGFYMWLFVHRPFEVYPLLGELQIERAYMLCLMLCWAIYPGKVWPSNRLHLAVLVFFLGVILTWVASPYMQAPGVADAVEHCAKVAVFYVLVVTTMRDEKNLRTLVLLFIACVGVYMAHSMWECLHGRYIWRMGIRRMIGVDQTYSDPNAFASTLVVTLPLTLPFWLTPSSKLLRLTLVGYTLAVCGCVLLTGSRAGLVGLGGMGILGIFYTGHGKKLLAAIIVAAPLAFMALPEELQNRFITLVDPSVGPRNAEESAEGRVIGLAKGYLAFEQSPIVGWGPSSFAISTKRGGGAHNVYGQILSEMGLVGVGAMLFMLFAFWRNCAEASRYARESPGQKRGFASLTVRGVGLSVLLLLLLGWSGHNLYRYNWQWFAAFQVVAISCLRAQAVARPFVLALPVRRPIVATA
jgi:O-antigen ligase